MSKWELDEAADHIRAREYRAAHRILEPLAKTDATAQQWLAQLYEVAPHLKRKRPYGFTLLIGFVGLVVLTLLCMFVMTTLYQFPEGSEPTVRITTDQGQVFYVPGQAFISLNTASSLASPNSTINIWRSTKETNVACKLEPGSQVLLQASFRNENGLYYFRVSDGDNCVGWISEAFLKSIYR